MPSTVRLDASITGPALDALRAGSTEERVPQWQAGQGGQSRNAYAPTAPRPASTSQLGGVVAALAAVVAVVALGFVAVRVLRAPSATVAVVGAWRTSRPAATVAAYAPPAVETAAPPAAQVAAPALAPASTVDVVAAYAARPTMTLWCDNQRAEIVSARQVPSRYAAGCVAAYGWCSECQQAWQDAHP